MTKDKTGSILVQNLEKLKTEKQNYDNVNQQIADLVRQNSANFNRETSPGFREDEEIFDTTATRAAQTLASILQSRLTTPGEKWLQFKHPDKELMKNEEVNRFYNELSDDFFNITKSTTSQFYQKCHEFFLDLPVFGTGAMFITKEGEDIVYDNRRLQEIYCAENNKGVIDTLYREFKLTIRQAVQEFGEENLDPKISAKLKTNPEDKEEFIHVTLPMKDYLRLSGKKEESQEGTYKSLYIYVKDKSIVKEGHFNNKPFVVTRWTKRIGEVYGIGAAWDVLSDIEVLNVLSMLELEASELAIRPPLLATDEGVIGEPEWIPGGITYGAMSEDGKRLLEQVVFNYDITKGIVAKDERIKNIESAFFIDQFREREGIQPLTATEAIQNQEKFLALLSPQTKRIEDEFLTPLALRTVGLRLEGRKIEIPGILKGKELEIDIEYLGPLSFSRRSSELTKYNIFLQNIAGFVQVHPEGLDNFDLDKMERDIAEKSGIPFDNIKKKKDVAAIRQARAEQEQVQQELINLETGASAAEKFSKIEE